ncbi:MAG TPA: hypothetical protein QGF35_04790 [Dehalococcoidia bacterium]|nr:hypothetical protein [Dehalococcoidia bacterium]
MIAAPTTSSTATPNTTVTVTAGLTEQTDWLDIAVQAAVGTAFPFLEANNDRSACTYFNMPNGTTLA